MSTTEPSRLSPGDVVDDFEILEVLSVGGSSTTFRARHRTLEREVSFKYVHPAVFGDDSRAIEEARADATRIARLEHPGVAPIFAAGEHLGGLYVASALLQGKTLAERGGARDLTPDDTSRIVTDVATALEHAHERSIVHRDLRPESLMVDRWGHGVVKDFGVTRVSGRTGLLTRAEVLESMRYTAPELVLGRRATAATDSYGLAAVAVWCLTGAPPYEDRPPAEYVRFRMEAVAPTLYAPDGSTAEAINAVLVSAMAPVPETRPSAAVFAKDLAAAIARLPPSTRAAGCPFERRELPSAAGAVMTPSAGRDATRIESRRPLPVGPSTVETPTPWLTWLACTLAAVTVGLLALIAGRVTAEAAPAPLRVGGYSLAAGSDWTSGTGVAGSKLEGVGLVGGTGETATIGVLRGPRLPGDPVPARLLPSRSEAPSRVTSARASLVAYENSGGLVIARPTAKGALFASCSRSTGASRCAALVTNAKGPDADLPTAPRQAVSDALRQAMTAVQQATGIASAEARGGRSERAGAAGRLAGDLREVASGLAIDGLDDGTRAALRRVQSALAAEAGGLDALSGAIDRKSDPAYTAAKRAARDGHARLVSGLTALRRAGYPVKP